MDNRGSNNFDTVGFLKTMGIFILILVVGYPFLLLIEKKTDGERNRYYLPGLAAYEQDHYIEAERDLKQFAGIYQDNPAILYNLGICTLAEGKKEEARSYFETATHHYGGKGRTTMCDSRLCGDLSKDMLAWMAQNPNWEPSQSTTVPPFPVTR